MGKTKVKNPRVRSTGLTKGHQARVNAQLGIKKKLDHTSTKLKMTSAMFSSTDFLTDIKSTTGTVFSPLVDEDTRMPFTIYIQGKVFMTPTNNMFGSISYGTKVDEGAVKEINELTKLLKFPITKNWTILNGLKSNEEYGESVFLKLIKTRPSDLFLPKDENWVGKEVVSTVDVGAYFDKKNKRCGLYYTVRSVSLARIE